MARPYAVAVLQYAAYTVHNLTVSATGPDDAATKALALSQNEEGRFEHCGSAPDDTPPAFVLAIAGERVPFERGALATQHPAAADLVDAARRVLAPIDASHDAVAREDLRAALTAVTGEAHLAPVENPSISGSALLREMRLLHALVGTTDRGGLAEMRGIAQRARTDVAELVEVLAELRAALALLSDASHTATLARSDAVLSRVRGESDAAEAA